jgi:L-ascorbate metabolism protein UlaG (beta-lactamase superfamily)
MTVDLTPPSTITMVRKKKLRHWLVRFLGCMALLGVVDGIVAIALGWRAFGKRPAGARRARMERSPNWKNGHFVNPEPMENHMLRAVLGIVNKSRYTSPDEPVATQSVDPKIFRMSPVTWLRVTWFGHSSFLVEIEGCRLLVDPVWSPRISPIGFIGPKRWYDPLIPLGELPPPDAVVISHDHYDHLDYATIRAMKDWDTTFVVPLGVGSHLEYWGVPAERIVELDWWERTHVRGVEIVATPARHISGRTVGIDTAGTLWSGWAFLGRLRRVYYSGDTSLFPGITEIGERLGPFDVTLIDAGEYSRYWPDWHIGPEQAVLAHRLVRGRVLIPVHWGLFSLAYHAWTEPVVRVLSAAEISGVTVAVPKPGQSIEPIVYQPKVPWWPVLPGKTAEEDPVISSRTAGMPAGH